MGLLSLAVLQIGVGVTPSSAEAMRGKGVVGQLLLGRSVRGRPLRAVELGDPASRVKMVIVGCIHGDECAGIAVVRALEAIQPPPGIDLWLLENMNPDGLAADTRQNADGVDLNRNFPWLWRPLGRRGDRQYSGRRPLGEPESRIVDALLLRLRPRVVIWYHQSLGLVDESGGRSDLERRYARIVGLPLVRLTRYPGSATSWVNHRFPTATSFVVELRAGPLSASGTRVQARGVLALARLLH